MTNILMPKLGLTMEEGVVIKWRVREGEAFSEGDVLLEVMSNKAVAEVEAYFSGKLIKILIQEQGTAPVGDPVAEAEENE